MVLARSLLARRQVNPMVDDISCIYVQGRKGGSTGNYYCQWDLMPPRRVLWQLGFSFVLLLKMLRPQYNISLGESRSRKRDTQSLSFFVEKQKKKTKKKKEEKNLKSDRGNQGRKEEGVGINPGSELGSGLGGERRRQRVLGSREQRRYSGASNYGGTKIP